MTASVAHCPVASNLKSTVQEVRVHIMLRGQGVQEVRVHIMLNGQSVHMLGC